MDPRKPAPDAPAAAAGPSPDPLEEFFWREGEAAPDLPGMGSSLPGAPRRLEAARTEFIAFRLGAEAYAFEIDRVREVLRAPTLTEVPRCPPQVAGVILVRGEVVTVHDPRRRLGLPGAPGAGARVIVCEADGERVGLLVDGVSQVLRLAPNAIEVPSRGMASIDPEYLAGVGRDEGHIYILLDLDALIGSGAALEATR
jgi:purine-binding chemotaxis protein CheW